MRGYFAQVRRAGFDAGISAAKLTKAMVEVLLQLPTEVPPSKKEEMKPDELLSHLISVWRNAQR